MKMQNRGKERHPKPCHYTDTHGQRFYAMLQLYPIRQLSYKDFLEDIWSMLEQYFDRLCTLSDAKLTVSVH